jgi:NAD(P)-dependent dehydrogenase (short-subunit alcohol dehydrogenase family)
MSKNIAVVGFGPGVSRAVAERFGSAGYSVALVARNAERLEAGVAALAEKGITAGAFPADASHPAQLRAALGDVRARLGPIAVLHWNAYGGGGTGDLLGANESDVRGLFDISVAGLLAAVQEILPDLKAAGDGAVLVTNGAFGDLSPQMDAYAVSMKAMGVAVANAAKHKLVGLLSERLKGDGVYVGEVVIAGAVKGTAWASEGGIDPAVIAERFWQLFQARGEIRARVA